MNVSSWSIKNPIPAVMLFVLLTFGGILSFNAMKVQNFPDIDLPTVSVSASLPGAAPAQLETEVARKLENSIATVQGLKHIMTKVQDGGVSVIAEFRLEKPVQEAVDDVRSAVARCALICLPTCATRSLPRSICRASRFWPSRFPLAAWTPKRCRGLSITPLPASCWRCAAWAR